MEWGIIDLRETPQEFQGLGFSRKHVLNQLEFAVGLIKQCTLEAEKILNYPVELGEHWEIPARYAPNIFGYCGSYPYSMPANLSQIYTAYRSLMRKMENKTIRVCGVEEVTAIFGALATNPRVVNLDWWGKAGRRELTIQLVLALANSPKFDLVVSRTTCHVRTTLSGRVFRLGILDGRLLGLQNTGIDETVPVDVAGLEVAISQPRGFIVYDTISVLDRIRAWNQRENLFPLYREFIDRSINFGKLSLDHSLDVVMQRALLNPDDFTGEDPTLKTLLFTDMNLASIQELWANSRWTSLRDRFSQLYDQLVPTYIDDRQFVKFFTYRPHEIRERVSNKQRYAMTSGFEKFLNFYLRLQRMVSNGSQLKMTGTEL